MILIQQFFIKIIINLILKSIGIVLMIKGYTKVVNSFPQVCIFKFWAPLN